MIMLLLPLLSVSVLTYHLRGSGGGHCLFLLYYYFIMLPLNVEVKFCRLLHETPLTSLSRAFNSNIINWQTLFWAHTQTLSYLELMPSSNKV